MRNPEAILKKRLEKAERVAVLGMGSMLRGDDAAGLLAAEHLAKRCRGNKSRAAKVHVFMGETAPENLTGEIRNFHPTHIILLDATDAGLKPGQFTVIDPDAVNSMDLASTHKLPINVFTAYLRGSIGCDVMVVGIQPASRKFGEPACEAVRKCAAQLADLLALALQRSKRRKA